MVTPENHTGKGERRNGDADQNQRDIGRFFAGFRHGLASPAQHYVKQLVAGFSVL
jgi:hypothetical protein